MSAYRVIEASALGEDSLQELFARQPSSFLVPRINLEAFGLSDPMLSMWVGVWDEGQDPEGVMFRINNTLVAVDLDGGCAGCFARMINDMTGIAGIRGSATLVAGIRDRLRAYRAVDWEDSYLMELNVPPKRGAEVASIVRRATIVDLDPIAALYADAGTMYRSRANLAERLSKSRVVVVQDPNYSASGYRFVSSALVNPEGRDAGLIGGVYTQPRARGRGYAGACVTALCLELLADGKKPVLFYENAVAGRVYQKLGFEHTGKWAVLYLRPSGDNQGL